jgi:hypothetical protein
MKWFSIGIEVEGRHEDSAELLDAWIDVLEQLPDVAGTVASWGGIAGGPGARFSLEAADVPAAAKRAVQLIEEALAKLSHRASIAQLDIATEDYLDAWIAQPGPEYAGVAEVAEMLKVTKQRVFQLRDRPDFPRPIAELAAGPVWTRDSLNNFLEGWERRPGRPARKRAS